MKLNLPSPLEKLKYPLFDEFGLSVYMKRDDKIDAEISGNKWRKLKLNIEKFKQGKYDKILTFGGAYSNHIAATAKAGELLNIPTIGVIRGNELNINSNSTLHDAHENGMNLVFVERSDYQFRYERWYWESLRNEHGNILIIEEGGANYHGLLGVSELVNEIDLEMDYIVSAAGTGTTLAGLLYGVDDTKVIGVPVFKKGGFIQREVEELLLKTGLNQEDIKSKMNLLSLELDYHFGGYGKFNDELIFFINDFYNQTEIKLDQIYTAKMVSAFIGKVKDGFFKEGDKIVLLHTGGLQGLQSIQDKLLF